MSQAKIDRFLRKAEIQGKNSDHAFERMILKLGHSTSHKWALNSYNSEVVRLERMAKEALFEAEMVRYAAEQEERKQSMMFLSRCLGRDE